MAKVRDHLILLPIVLLISKEAELRLLPVDGSRNPESTATIILHLNASDAKVNTELALQNLVKDISKGPLTASTSANILGKTDTFVTEGKNAIKENCVLVEAFKDSIPIIDNFVAAMDKITDVRAFAFYYYHL